MKTYSKCSSVTTKGKSPAGKDKKTVVSKLPSNKKKSLTSKKEAGSSPSRSLLGKKAIIDISQSDSGISLNNTSNNKGIVKTKIPPVVKLTKDNERPTPVVIGEDRDGNAVMVINKTDTKSQVAPKPGTLLKVRVSGC